MNFYWSVMSWGRSQPLSFIHFKISNPPLALEHTHKDPLPPSANRGVCCGTPVEE